VEQEWGKGNSGEEVSTGERGRGKEKEEGEKVEANLAQEKRCGERRWNWKSVWTPTASTTTFYIVFSNQLFPLSYV
jgi:hypothetical protein